METNEAQNSTALSGLPCPKCDKVFSNAIGLRMHDIRKHQPGRGWDSGNNFKGKKGKPWTPEHRANFTRTVRRKLREKAKREDAIHKDRIQIVYPDPREETEKAAVRTPDHCPHCGENIKAWRYEP